MLSLEGWLNGLTAALVVVFAGTFSIIILIRSLKMENVTVLQYGALMGLFAGLLWLGPATDFFTILITGENLNNENGLYGILSYMWVGPASTFALALGSKLTAPKQMKLLVGIVVALSVVFEFYIFLFTMDLFEFHSPEVAGENLIDSNFIRLSPGFFLIAIFVGMVFIFCGIGSLRMAAKSTGEIRKRFLYLATSFLLFCIVAIFDALLAPSLILFIVRLGMIACAFFLYYGVKPVD